MSTRTIVKESFKDCKSIYRASTMSYMSSRKFATLDFEERQQVVDGIYRKLGPEIEKAVGEFLKGVEPRVREVVRDEIGKYAVTEKQARSFIDGMILDGAEKVMQYFRPSWLGKLLFRRRT